MATASSEPLPSDQDEELRGMSDQALSKRYKRLFYGLNRFGSILPGNGTRYLRCYNMVRRELERRARSASGSVSLRSPPRAPRPQGRLGKPLGEKAVLSIPPLIVPHVSTVDHSIITDNRRRMTKEVGTEATPGITDDKVAWQYVPGQPLVRPEEVPLLSTRMYELHEWYLREVKKRRESLMVKVKAEHYFHELEVWVELPEIFQLFNQDALDKSLVSCYCLMKIYELKKAGRYDIGFIDPNVINEKTWSLKKKDIEKCLLQFLKQLYTVGEILFPYNFSFHWILLIIEVDLGKVKVLDSLYKEPIEYAVLKGMVNRVWQNFIKQVRGTWKQELTWVQPKTMRQAGNNLCAFYVCENMRIITESSKNDRNIWMSKMQDKPLPTDRVRAIQEELAGFLLDHVINPEGEYHNI